MEGGVPAFEKNFFNAPVDQASDFWCLPHACRAQTLTAVQSNGALLQIL